MSILLSWRPSRPVVCCALRRLVQTQSSQLPGDEIEPEPTNKNVSRIVNVAIIGAPNAGKSTFINHLVGRKVCAASSKVHTTRSLARAMTVVGDAQIIFLDTPGVVADKEKKRYELPTSMIESYHKSLRIADVIGVLHDVTSTKARESLHWDVARILQDVENIPCFLVLNKVDMMKEKKPLLSMIRMLTNGWVGGQPVPGTPVKPSKDPRRPRGYSKFSDVFMVSALRGDGVEDVKQYLVNNAKRARTHYDPASWSDQTPEKLIEETVRAKLMDFLPQEIPYRLMVDLEYYEEMVDRIVTSVIVTCPTVRICRLVGGSGGGRINQIQTVAKGELAGMFLKPVTLEIRLKHHGKEN